MYNTIGYLKNKSDSKAIDEYHISKENTHKSELMLKCSVKFTYVVTHGLLVFTHVIAHNPLIKFSLMFILSNAQHNN